LDFFGVYGGVGFGVVIEVYLLDSIVLSKGKRTKAGNFALPMPRIKSSI
jgi:hypothetical protein